MRGRLVRFGIVAGGLLAGGLAFIQLSAPAVAVQAVELDGQPVPPLGALARYELVTFGWAGSSVSGSAGS